MLLQDLKHLACGPRECRRFALTIGPILAMIGLWLAYRGQPAHPWLWIPALLLLLLGLTRPTLLHWPYRLWMTLGLLLGSLVSTVLLTLFYYLLMTPIGLLARLSGKDFLEQKPNPSAPSHWHARPDTTPRPPEDYTRQF